MSEFAPVSTMADLDLLDQDEIVAGYLAGLSDPTEPGSDKSRSYWHGWRNAQSDRYRVPPDIHQQQLAAEIVRKWRAH